MHLGCQAVLRWEVGMEIQPPEAAPTAMKVPVVAPSRTPPAQGHIGAVNLENRGSDIQRSISNWLFAHSEEENFVP